MKNTRNPLLSDRHADSAGRPRLLQWAAIFLLAAVGMGLLAFGGVRPGVTELGRGFFALFLALSVGSLALHFYRRRRS